MTAIKILSITSAQHKKTNARYPTDGKPTSLGFDESANFSYNISMKAKPWSGTMATWMALKNTPLKTRLNFGLLRTLGEDSYTLTNYSTCFAFISSLLTTNTSISLHILSESTRAPSSSPTTSGHWSVPSSDASTLPHMNSNLTVTSSHKTTRMPFDNNPDSNMVNFINYPNFLLNIFIFVHESFPFVHIQAPSSFPV